MPVFPLPHRRAHQHACRGVTAAAATASATMKREATATWEDDVAGDEAMGPAFRATLAMLEWPRLCKHVAAFAATSAGKAVVQVRGMWSAPEQAPARSPNDEALVPWWTSLDIRVKPLAGCTAARPGRQHDSQSAWH